jgi:ketosteroid isomerase-like protein
MKTLSIAITLILIATLSYAQSAESLKERIQEHYTAIHTSDINAVLSHHLQEFTLFPNDGSALWEPGWEKTYEKMGATFVFPKTNVTMKHFSSQIYNNVGVATFYLDGSHGDINALWRVTAVWVWTDGVWKEAHHHESKLIN